MKLDWRGALGIVLSVALLGWTLRDVSFPEVWEVLRHANPWLLLGSTALATAIFPLRARRWRPILHDVSPDLPLGPLWRATAIGMMVNNVVPARAGEIARAFALARERRDVPFAAAFASLVVDRVFDSMVILLLMAWAMLAPTFPVGTTIAGQPVARIAIILGITMVAGLGVVATLAYAPDRIVQLFEAVAGRVLPSFQARGAEILRSFATGVGVLRNPTHFVAVFLWTVVHWLCNAAAFWLAFKAVGVALPFTPALFLQGVIAVGVAIPSSPGFFGVFEALGRAGLGVYGVPGDLAVSWAIAFHLLSYIPITLMGAVYFARMGLRLGELGREEQAAEARA
jgi:uncharacterized protein (TIRG00374 family)